MKHAVCTSRREGAAHGGAGPRDETARYRAAERQWQNEIGCALLDKPYETSGSAAVFARQWERIVACLRPLGSGLIVEVGCGKGHLLRHLGASLNRPGCRLVGIDLSRAVRSLPAHGLTGVMADGEFLPLRNGCAAALVYDGALHHIIDYDAGLHEAIRVLQPGGLLILFEPVSSRFSRLVHRLLDPLVFRKTVYESPIDRRYKDAFSEERIVAVLRACGMTVSSSRTDFLAYPLTGCYAGSVFSRSERLMRWLLALEAAVAATPLLRRAAWMIAWRFLIVARKAVA